MTIETFQAGPLRRLERNTRDTSDRIGRKDRIGIKVGCVPKSGLGNNKGAGAFHSAGQSKEG